MRSTGPLAGWLIIGPALISIAASLGNAQTPLRFYQIGNSFTVDSQPIAIQAMAGDAGQDLDIGFHINCGSSATRIVANPTSTCVSPNSFGAFSEALPNNEWDAIAIQSHSNPEATLGSEIAAFTQLIDLAQTNSANADTEFFLYQPWGFRGGIDSQADWLSPITLSDDQPTRHRRDFFLALHDQLEANGDEITIIPAGDVIFRVLEEIEAGNIEGLSSADQIYRDNLHLSLDVGRFIASTAVLTTLLGEDLTGLERPSNFFGDGEALPDALRNQLQTIVWDVVRSHPNSGVSEQFIASDYNFDNQTTVEDLEVWRSDFGSATDFSADGNRDFIVSAADFTILRDSLTSSASSAILSATAPQVPEPSATLLLLGAATPLFSRRR